MDTAERAKKTIVSRFNTSSKMAAPSTLDWRARGAVTGIKNQQQCGGCWAFSTTGNIEGQWAIAGNALTSLSEQELISCDTSDSGCGGGLPTNAFSWIVNSQSGQIVTEASYPFTSGGGNSGSCTGQGSVGATIAGFNYVTSDESDMATWAATYGPVSIGVDAQTWQTYSGGIMTDCYGTSLDHAVLIVGYNLVSNPPFWIVKNQWGQSWCESCYIQIEYGTNQCGISQNPSSSYV